MAFITKQDLAAVLYEANIDVITQGDDTIVNDSITAAIQEAQTYLKRYDTVAIFASTGAERVKYTLLIKYIAALAKWHLMGLSQASIDYEITTDRYNIAIKRLKEIEDRVMDGWPLIGATYKSKIRFGSNKKFFTERL